MSRVIAWLRPRWAWILLLLVASSFAIGPLLLPGYHWGAQDARHSVYFLHQFDRAIQDGVFYPRWAPDFTFGYGYPFFNIYGPLPSYLGEALHLLGLSLVDAVKAVFALAALASALTAYMWLRLYCPRPAAVLGALLYLYAPYHIADLYVRASLAEAVALAVVPLCLWAFGRLYPREGQKRAPGAVAVAGISYALLMFSSNVIALLVSPILGAYVLVYASSGGPDTNERGPVWRRMARWAWGLWPAVLAVAIGLALSAIFWVPAFLEHQFVRTDQWVGGYYEYRNHFVYPAQLLLPSWGFGSSLPGPDDGMSFQLGLAPVALAILGLRQWTRLPIAWRRTGALLLALVMMVITLMLPISEPVWEALGLVSFAQFPWRLLALTLMGLAFLGTALFVHWPDDWTHYVLTAFWALIIILSVYPYLRSEIVEPAEGPVSLQGLMRFQQSADEMTGCTSWVQEIPRWSPLADQIMAGIDITTKVDYGAAYATGKLAVHSQAMGTTYERVWFQAEDGEQSITFYTFYYPGWNAYLLDEVTAQVTGRAQVLATGPQGRITVPVPSGRHVLLLAFEDTPVRAAATWVSAAAVILTLLGWLFTGLDLTSRQKA